MAEKEELSLTPEEQKKTIVIEFVGGFKDGLELRTDSEDKNESDQVFFMYLAFSKRGKIGSKFRTTSDAGIAEMMEIIEHTPEGPRLKREPAMDMNHFYEVTDRQEDEQRSASVISTWDRKTSPGGSSSPAGAGRRCFPIQEEGMNQHVKSGVY